jgi:hypothetical protein
MEGEDDDGLEDDEGPDFGPISVCFTMSMEMTMGDCWLFNLALDSLHEALGTFWFEQMGQVKNNIFFALNFLLDLWSIEYTFWKRTNDNTNAAQNALPRLGSPFCYFDE